MDRESTKVIACATVFEEIFPHLPEGMACEKLDFGLHQDPKNLRIKLQETINVSSEKFDTLLLGYGLCSLALIGIGSKKCTLVIPKMHDCIGIFLGSQQAYNEQVHKAAGTYYLTKGWVEVNDTPFKDYDRWVLKYGVERANRVMTTLFSNYTRLVYINTGITNNDYYIDYVNRTAIKFGLSFEEVPGSKRIITKLINGPWDDEFVVIEPGKVISANDFSLF